jgi:hypothetical protein
MYSDFLKKNPDPSYFLLRSFVINYVVFWIDDRGPGHFKTLNGIFKDLFEKSLVNLENKFKDDLIEFDYTFYFIFEYITEILFKFTKNNKFDSMEYFSSVFVKNIDVWGFIMTYLPILEKLYDHFDELSEPEIKIIDKIKNIILFCIECSTEPIEINKLVEQLKELNPLFLRAAKQTNVHFLPKSESQSSISKKTKMSSSGTKISSNKTKISSNKTKKTSIKQKSSNNTRKKTTKSISNF